MNLRTAALNALIATTYYRALYRSAGDLTSCSSELIDAQICLLTALGIADTGTDAKKTFDAISMLETIAARISRSPETALLGGAILRAIGDHRAETLTKTILETK
jgi:hypothetical protein